MDTCIWGNFSVCVSCSVTETTRNPHGGTDNLNNSLYNQAIITLPLCHLGYNRVSARCVSHLHNFSPLHAGAREPGWVTCCHAAAGQSAMKAFPFAIKRSLSEEQSLGESTTLALRCSSSSGLAKTNERGGNCRQTKITFPIKVPASSGSQKPPVVLCFLTALISPLISLPVEKPHERGYEGSKQLI